jgi:hypothetical protein
VPVIPAREPRQRISDGRCNAPEQLQPVFAELGGLSTRKIAAELNARNIATPAGGKWHAVTVKRVMSRLG